MLSSLEKFLNQKSIRFLINFLFAVFLLYYFIQFAVYHWRLITHPFPLEYREGVMTYTTHLFVKGQNPWDISTHPAATNMYGIFYHLLVYPFAKIGGATLPIHRAVTGFFLLACLSLVAVVLKNRGAGWPLACSAALLLYPFLLAPGTTTAIAGPNTLGLFLMLSALYIPMLLNYSPRSLAISILAGTLAFFTKPYFILCFPFLALYLFFFVSPRKAILYGIVHTAALLISILIINHFFNCYLNDVFYGNLFGASAEPAHAKLQFAHFFRGHWTIIRMFMIGMALWLVTNFTKFFPTNLYPMPFRFSLSLFCFILSTAVVYFKLGQHPASWMGYLYQLMSPFLILTIFEFLGKVQIWRIIFLPMIVGFLAYQLGDFPKTLDANRQEWDILKNLVATHQDILNTPLITPLLVDADRPVYDSGHSEYFKMGAYRKGLNQTIFKPQPEVVYKHFANIAEIREKVINKKFDLLILTREYAPFAPAEITQYYQPVGSLYLLLPHFKQGWDLTVWQPKP